MNEFGETLKQARIEAKKTLRETGAFVGLSIGYLSDIEQGRKNPPDLETVRKLQEFLRVKNDDLITLAADARTQRPTEVIQRLQQRTRLSELFFRAKDLSDERLEELIDEAKK